MSSGLYHRRVIHLRNTLDHFDAIKIGLTATPAAHTTACFKDIVYRYNYERAVREGFLVDYDVVIINAEVRLNGVFLQEGEPGGVYRFADRGRTTGSAGG